ncbi:MAG: hypothetical protein ACYCUV_02925 [Phycisphaerae bacterium]
MHKLLLAGLLSAGMLAVGSTGPAQAMKPASNADLRGSLGLYVGNSCTVLGECSPNTGTTPCGPSNTDGSCVNNYNGEFQNYTCGAPAVIDGCTGTIVTQYCSSVQYGTCSYTFDVGYQCVIQPGTGYTGVGYFTSCHY